MGLVLSDIPRSCVGYSMLLQATDNLFVLLRDPKTNGFKAPLNSSVTDLCFFNKSNPTVISAILSPPCPPISVLSVFGKFIYVLSLLNSNLSQSSLCPGSTKEVVTLVAGSAEAAGCCGVGGLCAAVVGWL